MGDLAKLHAEQEAAGRKLPPNRADAVHHTFGAETIEPPTEWHTAYSDADKEAVSHVLSWLAAGAEHVAGFGEQRTRAKLARAAGLSPSTVSLILAGKYVSSPTRHLRTLSDVITRDTRRAREIVRLPWVDTTVSRQVYATCHRAHMYRDIGLIAGRPGTGKTEALKRYANEVEAAILIEASYNMSAGLLLDELIDRTRAVVRTAKNGTRGTQAQRLRAVIEALQGTDRLIIIDEADTLTGGNLEHLRRISDLGGVGIVLAGEPRLQGLVRDPDGRFGRIHSRIGFWTEIIRAITEDDCRALVTAAHEGDQVQLTDEVIDAYWQVCEGSARTLSKLIPNLRDFGLAQGKPLSPALIFYIAQKTMGMVDANKGRRS